MKFLTEDDKKNLRLEYELLKKGILERNNRLYFADSILVSVSVLVILALLEYKSMMIDPLFQVSFLLFLIPFVTLSSLFFLHYSAQKVNQVEHKGIDEISKVLGLSGFPTAEMHKKKLEGKWWFELRKWVWFLVILILIVIDVCSLLLI